MLCGNCSHRSYWCLTRIGALACLPVAPQPEPASPEKKEKKGKKDKKDKSEKKDKKDKKSKKAEVEEPPPVASLEDALGGDNLDFDNWLDDPADSGAGTTSLASGRGDDEEKHRKKKDKKDKKKKDDDGKDGLTTGNSPRVIERSVFARATKSMHTRVYVWERLRCCLWAWFGNTWGVYVYTPPSSHTFGGRPGEEGKGG